MAAIRDTATFGSSVFGFEAETITALATRPQNLQFPLTAHQFEGAERVAHGMDGADVVGVNGADVALSRRENLIWGAHAARVLALAARQRGLATIIFFDA